MYRIGDIVYWRIWRAEIVAIRGRRVVIRLAATGRAKTVSVENVSRWP